LLSGIGLARLRADPSLVSGIQRNTVLIELDLAEVLHGSDLGRGVALTA
jgi:hypothetical protein